MRQLFLSFDGRIRTKDTRRPPHASPWWSRIISCRVADPWIGFWVSAFPEKHLLLRFFPSQNFPLFLSFLYISAIRVESHTFRTSMFSFLFQSRTPLVSRLAVFFSSFVIDRLSIFSLFPRTSDFFFVFTRSSLRAFLLFLSFAIVLQTKTFWHGAYSNPPCCG